MWTGVKADKEPIYLQDIYNSEGKYACHSCVKQTICALIIREGRCCDLKKNEKTARLVKDGILRTRSLAKQCDAGLLDEVC